MMEVRSTKQLRSLQKIDHAVARKYSLANLATIIKGEIRSHLKKTKVHMITSGQDTRSGNPFIVALSHLAMKRTFVVGRDLPGFCKKHRIRPVRKTTKSIMGLPIQHRGDVFGALVLENSKEPDAYGPEDVSFVAMLADRLGAEIANEKLAQEKNRLESEIRELVLFDSLTKLPNQRYFNLIVEMELKKAKGYSRQLSLAMIDLDHFRSLSARLGKKVVNDLLVHVAQILRRNVRDTDFVARYGVEEFVILLPEALNEAAVNVADRVRIAIEHAPFAVKGRGKKKLTISVGVVTYPSTAESLEALLEHVDKALKKAKQLGRNQVVTL
jgi:diguanylate cyclase (GGDEF)-like protein